MTETIALSATITVPNGPRIQLNRSLPLDAYDKLDVKISAGDVDKEVVLQPGTAGQVYFIAVVSDQYGDTLTYKVNDKTSTGIYKLDGPHLLVGVGAVGMLDPAPDSLFISNAMASEAEIQILVGRKATS